ncbi:hypothetical protein Trco_006878 [Trichoderma cornu-damae]|uniref:Uncharacterized protein n=1 Tax=Trichoderma cornu-damae TaxID=654480 RepID=A0A9P8QFS0_9HYPO|nr:hypothetical protein Trco_006878 [Trichoderma cornu-damae]
MEKGWAIAMSCSERRLRRKYEWTDAELDAAAKEGLVMLETVCVFVHGCVKSGQFKLPSEFWKILHAEYGIVVYPSALTERIASTGLGTSQTFSEVYGDHIGYMKEPLPVYEK